MARVFALAAAVGLAGCAESPADLVTPEPPSLAPGGLWVVTDVFPGSTAAVDIDMAKWRGRELRLDAQVAGDLTGRFCGNPHYGRDSMGKASFLGRPDRAADADLAESVPVLRVTCAGQPFGDYALWRDGSLLALVNGYAIRLARPESLPVAAVAEPLPAVPQEAHADPAPEPHGKRRLVYLASYRNIGGADRGWQTLKARSAPLAGLEPATREVVLGAKGKFIRLFVQAMDDDQAKHICRDLRRLLPDCGAVGRD
jgi:hypothetical protein